MTKHFVWLFFLLFLLTGGLFAQNKNQNQSPAPAAVSYGIIVDNSGSYRRLLERVVELSKDIVEENKPDDETFLARFVDSKNIKILQDLTGSKQALHDAADEMFIEGGQTAIVDAVFFSARHLAEKSGSDANRRKALILITDGDERKSEAKLDELLKFLKERQIKVFAVALADEKASHKVLDKLTKESGGRKYVPKTIADLAAIVKELANDIRIQ